MKSLEREHLDKIRQRFTHSAEPFAQFVFSGRVEEAQRFAAMATANLPHAGSAKAIDVACGPATFSKAVAPRVAYVVGADFTPAMMAQGLQVTASEGLTNLTFVCADAYALPFADGAFDLAICCYALHHLLEPAKIIREMARVIRLRGRLAIADLILPSGAGSAAYNGIERARDPSHATTLRESEVRDLFANAGLQIVAAEREDGRRRDFDQWMSVAGEARDSQAYSEARRLLEECLTNDAARVEPHLDAESGALQFSQAALFVVSEKTSEKTGEESDEKG